MKRHFLVLFAMGLTIASSSYKIRGYYKITWKNYDGTILRVDEKVREDSIPKYQGDIAPTRPSNHQYSFTFSSWYPNIEPVKKDITYTALFSESLNKFNITWKNYDGTTLKVDSLEYGTIPHYNGITPIKESSSQYSYNFFGWSPKILPVGGDAIYTAQFVSSVNKYTVNWLNYDGSILEKDENVIYGSMPSYDGETPTKPSSSNFRYEFNGWSSTISPVTGNTNYTATFKEIPIEELNFTFSGTNCQINHKYSFIDEFKKGDTISYYIIKDSSYTSDISLYVTINGQEASPDKYSFDNETGLFEMNNVSGNVFVSASVSS